MPPQIGRANQGGEVVEDSGPTSWFSKIPMWVWIGAIAVVAFALYQKSKSTTNPLVQTNPSSDAASGTPMGNLEAGLAQIQANQAQLLAATQNAATPSNNGATTSSTQNNTPAAHQTTTVTTGGGSGPVATPAPPPPTPPPPTPPAPTPLPLSVQRQTSLMRPSPTYNLPTTPPPVPPAPPPPAAAPLPLSAGNGGGFVW